MKITVEIECTPEEARTFFGLPDLGELQAAAGEALMERMRTSIGALDAQSLVETWFSGGPGGWEQMQKNLWAAAGVKPPGDQT